MQDFPVAELIYLVILGSALLAMFLVNHRQGLGTTLKQLISWALIFLAVLAGYGLWEDVRRTVGPSQAVITSGDQIVVPRARDGHYYLTLQVNDAPVTFMVDTGASDLVLTRDDAARVGLNPDQLTYFGRAFTANGEVRTAPVTLDSIQLGPFVDTRVQASVNNGEMSGSLLGMRYLERFSQIQILGGELVLTR